MTRAVDIEGRGVSVNGRSVGVGVEVGSAIPDSGDLRARYDARNFNLSDGDAVSTWADETGNGLDLSANGSPTYDESTAVGVPAVDISQSDNMDVSFNSSLSNPFHVFFLGRFVTDNEFEVIWGPNTAVSNGFSGFSQRSDEFAIRVLGSSDQQFNAGFDTNTHIFGTLINSSNAELRLDGTNQGSVDPQASALDGFMLGSNGNGSKPAQVEITEVLIYEGDKTSKASDIEEYLNRDTSLL